MKIGTALALVGLFLTVNPPISAKEFPALPSKLESAELDQLIATIHQEPVQELYYATFPPSVSRLMASRDVTGRLIEAYGDVRGDSLYRFSILVILNHVTMSASEKDSVADLFVAALKDRSSWVRTEAVWGLGRNGEFRHIPAVMAVLEDPDVNVVNEAILSLFRLTGNHDNLTSNQNMGESERIEAVAYWRKWWAKNRSRFDE